jgi:hypothetical protein
MNTRLRIACLVYLGSLASLSAAACRGAARVTTSAPDATASTIRSPLDSTPSAVVDLMTAHGPRVPFHVAARGSFDPFGKGPPSMKLCPIVGRTFVCGETQLLTVDGDAVRYEPDWEVGLRGADGKLAAKGFGVIEQVLGRWPEDAWLVVGDMNNNPAMDYILYRWGGSSWARMATVNSFDRPLVAPYGGGVLVESDSFRDTSDDKAGNGSSFVSRLEVVGSTVRRSPPRLHAFRRERGLGGGAWTVAPGGAVFAKSREVDDDKPLRVERLASGANASVVDTLTQTPGRIAFVAPSSRDVTAYGSAGKVALLSHFDGDRWTAEEAPPESKDVLSYARTADGVEWLVAPPRTETGHPSLWRRPSGGTWQLVDAPRLDPKLDAEVREVWAVGAEAWILVWVLEPNTARPVLLRAGPAAAEWVAPPEAL